MQHSEALIPMVALIVSGISLACSIFGWVVVYKLTVKRERDGRFRTFLSFLAAQKEELCCQHYRVQPQDFVPRYAQMKIEFRQESALIEGDIPKRAKPKFRQLIEDITGGTDAHAATHEGIKRVLDIIDDTQAFIKNNT